MASNPLFLTSHAGAETCWFLLTSAYVSVGLVKWFRYWNETNEIPIWDHWHGVFSTGLLAGSFVGLMIAGFNGFLAVVLLGTVVWTLPLLIYSFTHRGGRRNAVWVLLLTLCFFISWVDPILGPTVSAGRAKVTKANGEIRSLGTAMFDYHNVHGEFPTSFSQLTSPLEFISSFPEDPFHWPRKKYPEIGMYKLIVSADRQAFVVYSPGPDFDDDHAEIRYSPTNGTISNGDLIRPSE